MPDPTFTAPLTTEEKTGYGDHLQIHILPFQVDRTNLFTGRVEYHVFEAWDQPDAQLLSLSFGRTIIDLSGINNLATGARDQPYPSCVGVERRYETDTSMAVYTYTFEGIAVDHGEQWIEFELEFTMNQEPIETHPDYVNLNQIYGPYNPINRTWPVNIPQAALALGLQGVSPTPGATGNLNPLFGVSSYLVPGLTYRISYSDIDIDPGLMDDIGTIMTVMPPRFGSAFKDLNEWLTQKQPQRNWLKLAPKIRQHGSCISITEEYMLSGFRGWLDAVYGKKALLGTEI